MLDISDEQNIVIAPDHATWVRFGYAIARECGDPGRELFRRISRDENEANQKYNYLLRAVKDGYENPVSIGSLFWYMAQEHQIYLDWGSDQIDRCKSVVISKGFRYNEVTQKI